MNDSPRMLWPPNITDGSRDTFNALVFINGKIPLLHREASNGEQWWAMPGGKPEGHETPAQTIQREMLEEIGVQVNVRRHIDSMEHPFLQERHIQFYLCDYTSGTPQNLLPDEHKELLMADFKQALHLLGDRIPASVQHTIRQQAANEHSLYTGQNLFTALSMR